MACTPKTIDNLIRSESYENESNPQSFRSQNLKWKSLKYRKKSSDFFEKSIEKEVSETPASEISQSTTPNHDKIDT